MRKFLRLAAGFLMAAGAWGQKPPLLAEKDVAALAGEISGEAAKRNLEGIARFHRQRGSSGFHKAAQLVLERLREYGFSDATILQFPADGKIFYGTQRSRPAWDAESAELRLVWSEKSTVCSSDEYCFPAQFESQQSEVVIGSYEMEPVVLAEDSESANVTAGLVDVGQGVKESDYAGKMVKGKLVLVSAQPGAVQDLAVGKFGAAGIVSYAQNQPTAWSGENLDAIRWGHLETFSPNKTFGFMVSLRTARAFRSRLEKGEEITLHAVVEAGQHAGNYEVVTATIPGADAKWKDEEIAYSCHLDHQEPGANDNASGCATILEVARTLERLIAEEKLARPARTIRFIFPPEIEGTLALLNGRPELAKRIKAVVHMDMVGGAPETKAVFHVTRGPMSLPSFVQDVAWAFADWVNEETYRFAATGQAAYPLLSSEGGKEPLRAEYSAYTMGSDHDVYQDSSFQIPAIYMDDWPDRFIHTNFDSAANIDPTKLTRVGLIGAASGYFLAGDRTKPGDELLEVVRTGEQLRDAKRSGRNRDLGSPERKSAQRAYCDYEEAIDRQLQAPNAKATPGAGRRSSCRASQPAEDAPPGPARPDALRYRRAASPKGPMTVFGYDYFAEASGKVPGNKPPALLLYEGKWGSGAEYAYEVLNFAAQGETLSRIWERVSAEYGPVPREMVLEYLQALQAIGVVETVK